MLSRRVLVIVGTTAIENSDSRALISPVAQICTHRFATIMRSRCFWSLRLANNGNFGRC